MGKKTNTPAKGASPAKPAAKAAAKKKPASRKIPAPAAKPVKPISSKVRRTTKPAVNKAAGKAAITVEDIALRAYFIAEKRRQCGQNGDEHQDWVEAERQLRSEHKSPKKTDTVCKDPSASQQTETAKQKP